MEKWVKEEKYGTVPNVHGSYKANFTCWRKGITELIYMDGVADKLSEYESLLAEKDREIERLKEEVAVRDAVMDWNIEKHESLCNGLKALRDEIDETRAPGAAYFVGQITELLGEE
jgi:hypothetical protein